MRYTESRTVRNPSDFETFEGFSVLSEAPFGSVRGHDSDRPPAATFRTLSFLQVFTSILLSWNQITL